MSIILVFKFFIMQLYEATKDKFSPRKRCSFNKAEQHELSDLDVQAQEISRLQKELGEKSQIVSDLKSQLEARDDELDFLHGQLAIKEALESHKDEEITREEMGKENTDIDNLSLENLQMANSELSKVIFCKRKIILTCIFLTQFINFICYTIELSSIFFVFLLVYLIIVETYNSSFSPYNNFIVGMCSI